MDEAQSEIPATIATPGMQTVVEIIELVQQIERRVCTQQCGELASRVLEKICRSESVLDHVRNVPAFLKRVARNACIDCQRRDPGHVPSPSRLRIVVRPAARHGLGDADPAFGVSRRAWVEWMPAWRPDIEGQELRIRRSTEEGEKEFSLDRGCGYFELGPVSAGERLHVALRAKVRARFSNPAILEVEFVLTGSVLEAVVSHRSKQTAGGPGDEEGGLVPFGSPEGDVPDETEQRLALRIWSGHVTLEDLESGFELLARVISPLALLVRDRGVHQEPNPALIQKKAELDPRWIAELRARGDAVRFAMGRQGKSKKARAALRQLWEDQVSAHANPLRTGNDPERRSELESIDIFFRSGYWQEQFEHPGYADVVPRFPDSSGPFIAPYPSSIFNKMVSRHRRMLIRHETALFAWAQQCQPGEAIDVYRMMLALSDLAVPGGGYNSADVWIRLLESLPPKLLSYL